MSSIATESLAAPSVVDFAPAAVREFAIRHGLITNLQETIALASRVFDVAGSIALGIEEDPDTGESWIEMKVAARGSIEHVMKSHESYTERLLSHSAKRCPQIRLFLHIARD